ncbi:hypothetical protein R1flu_021450 [Riccia fluitans]|uniref:Homeobox domain-containing protein n=1 Tax=Riccia fluitans TaxID=41844 RepID=A0ABD1ZPY0_9MARC
MAPLQQQVQVQNVGGGAALVLTPSMENNLPQPVYMMGSGQVMTDEQLETLRRQISVYSTICQQLVEMHKASVSAQSSLAGMMVGQHISYDPLMGTPNHKTTARQRWTPSQTQLQILEKLFDQGNGTPNKQRIKEITLELSQHGQIAETNVYNWFQNRKARAKRKQHLLVTPTNGESEVDTDVESPKEKKPKYDKDLGQENSNSGGLAETAGGGHSSDGVGPAYDQKQSGVDHYDHQESASSGLMQPQAEAKQSGLKFGRAAGFERGFAPGGSEDSSLLTVLVDGKSWDVPSGVIDVKSSTGESTPLMDTRGQAARGNEAGISHQPLHGLERYRLSSGGAEGVLGSGSVAPGDVLAHNIQVVGLLNNGIANCTMLRQQTQSWIWESRVIPETVEKAKSCVTETNQTVP